MKDITNVFCTHVMRLLEERGISQSDLAKQCGISASILTEISKGVANPKLTTVSALAEALEVPVALLFLPEDSLEWQLYKFVPKEQSKKIPSGYGYIKDVVLPEGKIAIIKEWADSSIKRRGK